jgi:signal transduction histidine kinase
MGLGAQDYLVKHLVSNDSVIRCISYAIERRKSQDSTLRLAAIKDFTATLAHDLSVPFIGAKNVFNALLSGEFGELSADQTKVIRDLRNSNEKQLELVQKLLEVYRYEVDAPDLKFKNLDIEPLIKRCAANAAHRYPHSVPIVTEFSQNLPPVNGNEDALGRMFTNLLDNAIKYCNGVGDINVRTEFARGKLITHVQNYGSTIPDELQSGMFKEFWQGVPGKTYVAHTGLGLYLCHRIARLHNGKMTCRSTKEEGTTVTVILPASPTR